MKELIKVLLFFVNRHWQKKEADEYQYFKANTTFANDYVDEFLTKLLEIEIIPDILIETLSEMNLDEKNFNKFRLPSDRYIRNTRSLYYLPDHITHYDGKE